MNPKTNLFLITFFIILYSLISIVCFPEDIDISRIIQIESSENPEAIGLNGEIGLCQISAIVLTEWNNYHPNSQYDELDLFTPSINVLIAEWYYNKRIPQMLKHYGFEDTIESRITAYNFGIGNMVKWKELPKITKDYIKKYRRLK